MLSNKFLVMPGVMWSSCAGSHTLKGYSATSVACLCWHVSSEVPSLAVQVLSAMVEGDRAVFHAATEEVVGNAKDVLAWRWANVSSVGNCVLSVCGERVVLPRLGAPVEMVAGLSWVVAIWAFIIE
jgi:hypothetical protein